MLPSWLKNSGNSVYLNQKCQEFMRHTDTNPGLIPGVCGHKNPQDTGPHRVE